MFVHTVVCILVLLQAWVQMWRLEDRILIVDSFSPPVSAALPYVCVELACELPGDTPVSA